MWCGSYFKKIQDTFVLCALNFLEAQGRENILADHYLKVHSITWNCYQKQIESDFHLDVPRLNVEFMNQ